MLCIICTLYWFTIISLYANMCGFGSCCVSAADRYIAELETTFIRNDAITSAGTGSRGNTLLTLLTKEHRHLETISLFAYSITTYWISTPTGYSFQYTALPHIQPACFSETKIRHMLNLQRHICPFFPCFLVNLPPLPRLCAPCSLFSFSQCI